MYWRIGASARSRRVICPDDALLALRLTTGSSAKGDTDSEERSVFAFSRLGLGKSGVSQSLIRLSFRRKQRFRIKKMSRKITRAPPPAAMPMIAPVERVFDLVAARDESDEEEDEGVAPIFEDVVEE